MSHIDMGIVGATTDTFILFENGVRRNRRVLPGLSNAAGHMPSKPDPPTAPVRETLSDALAIVKPDTIVGWHRAGFRLYRRWKSRRRSCPCRKPHPGWH
jgi:hypothetical protein